MTSISAAIARPPVFCTPQVPLGKVLDAMHEARIGCMPVVDSAIMPVGIFTTMDVLECVAAPHAPMDTAIGNLMTRNPVTLAEDAALAEAALAMAQHGIRHVLVTRQGRLSGVVSQRDLFSLRRTESSLLVPVDGSALADRAVEHVIELSERGMPLKVLLLNVQPQWAPARSDEEESEGMQLHAEAAAQATRRAESRLADAHVPWETHMRTGPAAERILEFAAQKRCDQIVMGTRGLGTVYGRVLGSVAAKVAQRAAVPVTLLK